MEQVTSALVYLGSFITVLGVVVFVHEFGHFQVGRWCGIAVKSFSIGMGPEWFGWTDKHGTRWKVSRVPIGGFVSWVDDTDPSSAGPATAEHRALRPEEARRRGHFRAMPIWRRAATVAAGPLANFIFSSLVFAAMLFAFGRDVTDINDLPARVDAVQQGSAAAQAGLVPGDLIVSVDGQPISSFGALQAQVRDRAGESLAIVVRREGADRPMTITPQAAEDRDEFGGVITVGRIGVQRQPSPEERRLERLNPLEAVVAGVGATGDYISLTFRYIGAVLSGRASAEHIAGPGGIFMMSGQVAESALGDGETAAQRPAAERAAALAIALINLSAFLSVAVGIANLLPIPLLDGGQLLFYGVEAVRGGRQLPARVQEMTFWAGAFVLGGLFLFATWNDVQRHWQDLQNFFG
ncbi:MAG: PDZ domain-containing protein [Alphaproteobacteria bacterium]|nr:PDZ domain-containing protein [Alphaproteobacteria bacterium]